MKLKLHSITAKLDKNIHFGEFSTWVTPEPVHMHGKKYFRSGNM